METAMKQVAKTLYEFWNSFGIPAYPEYSVPDEATLPYITYEVKQPNWRGVASYSAIVWYQDTSFESIANTVDAISTAIGEGKRLVMDDGYLYLFKEDLFVQMQPQSAEGDENMKVAYLSMNIHVLA